MVASHWLRMMEKNEMKDICIIIGSFYPDVEGNGGTVPVYADWVARDKEQSAPQRLVNQTRFFRELQSVYDDDEPQGIMGVTLISNKNVTTSHCNQLSGTVNITTLHLNANGSYVFDAEFEAEDYRMKKRRKGLFDEGLFDEETEEKETDKPNDALKHCGVWDYKGDAIVMEGFGFATGYFGNQCFKRFSSEFIIRRPVNSESLGETICQWKKCNLSVLVYV